MSNDAADVKFHAEVLRIRSEWDAWAPDDDVKLLIKRAVDKC